MSWVMVKTDNAGKKVFYNAEHNMFSPLIEAATVYSTPPVKNLLQRKRNPFLADKYKNVTMVRIGNDKR